MLREVGDHGRRERGPEHRAHRLQHLAARDVDARQEQPGRQRARLVLDRRRRAHRVARARLRHQRVDLARERGREPLRPRRRRQRARRAFDGRQRARRGQRRRQLRAAGAQLREQIRRHDDRPRAPAGPPPPAAERPRLAADLVRAATPGPSRTQNVMDAGSLMIGSRPEEGRWPSRDLCSRARWAARRRWRPCCAGRKDARPSSCSARRGWATPSRPRAARWCWSSPRRARSRCARAAARTSRTARSTSRSPAPSCRSAARVLPALVVENVGGLQDDEADPLAGGAGAVPPSRGPAHRGRRHLQHRRRRARRGRVPVGGADGDRPGVAARRGIADHWCRAHLIRHRGTFRRRAR